MVLANIMACIQSYKKVHYHFRGIYTRGRDVKILLSMIRHQNLQFFFNKIHQLPDISTGEIKFQSSSLI